MTAAPGPCSGNPKRRGRSVINQARARRQAELRELDRLMRERVGLAPAPVPEPLHRMGQRRQRDSDSDDTATTGERP